MSEQEKYDDASWYLAEDYPADLPQENAFIHLAAMMNWLILHDMVSFDDYVMEEAQSYLDDIRSRQATPLAIMLEICDGVLISGDFTDEGNAFLGAYYTNYYIDDYPRRFGEGFQAPDTWEHYDEVAAMIDQRYDEWKTTGRLQRQGKSGLVKALSSLFGSKKKAK